MHEHHRHTHESEGQLSFHEKLIKLLEHWVKHNQDHAQTYRQWAAKVNDQEMSDVAALLEKAVEKTLVINQDFQQALELLKKS
jgi:hypothetical protein